MNHALTAAAALVALEHFYIFALEAFMWRGRARRVFGTSAEQADRTAVLAANQGIYNALVGAGLIAGLVLQQPVVIGLFLAYVVGAAVFGATTVAPQILLVQGAPAIVGAVLVCLNGGESAATWALGFLATALVCGAFGVTIKRREAALAV